MKIKTRQFDKRRGAALILVIVVTVLLAAIGMMFLMTSRLSEMETAAVANSRDLEAGVQTVVGKINDLLMADYDDPIDYNLDWLCSLEPVLNDNGTPANLTDDFYEWPRITDLWGTIQANPDSLFAQSSNTIPVLWVDPDDDQDVTQWAAGAWNSYQIRAKDVPVKIIETKDRMKVILENAAGTTAVPDPWDDKTKTNSYGARADADGDGVADSRWVLVPNLTTNRGESVYAAVRIIDNCAMLNLNTAFGFYLDPANTSPWHSNRWHTSLNNNPTSLSPYNYDGRTLSEINFTPFLRSYDIGHPERIQLFRDVWARQKNVEGNINTNSYFGRYFAKPQYFHDQMVMQIENPIMRVNGEQLPLFNTFSIDNELEIRNRFLLTSNAVASFEKRDPDESTDRSALPPFMSPGSTYDGVAYETFDLSRGTDVATGLDSWNGDWNVKVKRVPFDDLDKWFAKLDPLNFDNEDSTNTHDYEYDRRHLCTFYSYDQVIRKGTYPLLDSEIDAYVNDYIVANGRPTSFATNAEYKVYLKGYLWNAWEPIFTGKGAVTTDIAIGTETNPFNNTEARRRIVHLLYALRDYYFDKQSLTKTEAARKAVQIVANIIDFSDNTSVNDDTSADPDGADNLIDAQGPFYDPSFVSNGFTINYGQQANKDATFITRNIIRDLLIEASQDVLGFGNEIDLDNPAFLALDFGLNPADICFGYERQPFISEVYCEWDADVSNPLQVLAIELVNPYDTPIDMSGYTLKIGAGTYSLASASNVPAYSLVNGPGRLIVYRGSIPMTGLNANYFSTSFPTVLVQGDDNTISLLKSNPSDSGVVNIVNDQLLDADYDDPNDVTIFYDDFAGIGATSWSVTRDDSNWKFIYPQYTIVKNPASSTLGTGKGNIPNLEEFQIGCSDDEYAVVRWHDLETLALFGNGTDIADPNVTISGQVLNAANNELYFDLDVASSVYTDGLTDYICTMNRPDYGNLPGRININTAPVHVIAAAIPPTLAAIKSSGYDALSMAQEIVGNRPYGHLAELLSLPSFNHLSTDSQNVGFTAASGGDDQSIIDDIEERDWILSHLANKFTVRSDVFTAYILVRLGTDGPQRRMIAIFDRSKVNDVNDRPQLVALHAVPDPR